MAAMSGSYAGSSARYCDRSFSKMTICGSRVSGCSRSPVTSASGSSASTWVAPLARSIRTSRPVLAPTELSASSEPPSALNAIGWLVSASSAAMVSSGRQSWPASSRIMTTMLPSGWGAMPHRTTSSASATQPMKPGFSTSLTSSPVTRSSR